MKLTDDTLQAQCIRCKDTHVLMVSNHDLKRWEGGELIQNAMPYLTAGEREILISGVCETCFGKMYREDPIGDADTEYDIKFEEKK
jgi:hypothetical protein